VNIPDDLVEQLIAADLAVSTALMNYQTYGIDDPQDRVFLELEQARYKFRYIRERLVNHILTQEYTRDIQQ
jgi:hypothetical protein